MKKENIEKVYEKFLEDIEPTEEMNKICDKISKKFLKLKEELKDNNSEKLLEDLEKLYSDLNNLETKEAFYKGFSVATNLILEAKE